MIDDVNWHGLPVVGGRADIGVSGVDGEQRLEILARYSWGQHSIEIPVQRQVARELALELASRSLPWWPEGTSWEDVSDALRLARPIHVEEAGKGIFNVDSSTVVWSIRYCLGRLSYAAADGYRLAWFTAPNLDDSAVQALRRDISERVWHWQQGSANGNGNYADINDGWKQALARLDQVAEERGLPMERYYMIPLDWTP